MKITKMLKIKTTSPKLLLANILSADCEFKITKEEYKYYWQVILFIVPNYLQIASESIATKSKVYDDLIDNINYYISERYDKDFLPGEQFSSYENLAREQLKGINDELYKYLYTDIIGLIHGYLTDMNPNMNNFYCMFGTPLQRLRTSNDLYIFHFPENIFNENKQRKFEEIKDDLAKMFPQYEFGNIIYSKYSCINNFDDLIKYRDTTKKMINGENIFDDF